MFHAEPIGPYIAFTESLNGVEISTFVGSNFTF
jgi:hypothetical protein